MASIIGTITSQSGSFFIRHADGSITSAKVGDALYEGDTLLGSNSNSAADTVNISLADGSGSIQLAGAEEQLFDVTMLSGEIIEDTIVNNDEVSESLLQEAVSETQDNNLVAVNEEDLTLEDIENLPAAAAGEGEPTTDTGTIVARLEDRTADEVNITTDLRDQEVTDSTLVDTTIPADEILIDAVLTLEDITVQEGVGTATISASLDYAPLTPLVVTLSNGATINFDTAYVPGTLVQSSPFDIQGDDVYIDPESYSVVGESYVGGGFSSIVSNASTVSAGDTTNITTVTLSSADVNEDTAEATFTIQLSNDYNDYGGTATVQVAGETGTRTVDIDSNGTGTFTVSTQDSDAIIDGQTISATVTGLSRDTGVPGGYEEVDYTAASETINVTDTIDTTILTVNEALDSETGKYIYTAVVTNAPDSDLVITLNTGDQITITSDSTTASSAALDTQATSVISVTGGNYEDLDTIYGFGQDIIMTNVANNSIGDVDLNPYSDTAGTIDISLSPRTNAAGFAVNINGDELTSTDGIGTENQGETHYIKYDTTDPTNIQAYRVLVDDNGNVTNDYGKEQVVFTISLNATDQSYSVSLNEQYPLDGVGYTNTLTFDSTTSATGGVGGNDTVLLFSLSDLYVVASAEDYLNVNYNASGDLGVEQSNDVDSTETLILNFANSSITSNFDSSGNIIDTNGDGTITNVDVDNLRTDLQDLNNVKTLSSATFTLFIDSNLKSATETVGWQAYNHGVLVATDDIEFSSSDLFSIGNSQDVYASLDVLSSVDSGSIVLSQENIDNGWLATDTSISYNGTGLSDTISFTYDINGVEYTASNFTLNQGETIDLDSFNEVSFTGINTGTNTSEFSLYSMDAVSTEDIPPENQAIIIDVDTSDGTNTAAGIVQITFDGDNVIIGTDEDEAIDYDALLTSIDGGEGIDTFVLSDTDSLDLSTTEVRGVENFDLTDDNSSGQSITNLSLADVLDMDSQLTGITADNIDPADTLIKITGDSTDNVSLSNEFTQLIDSSSNPLTTTIDEVEFNIYANTDNDSYKVLIQTGVDVDIPE